MIFNHSRSFFFRRALPLSLACYLVAVAASTVQAAGTVDLVTTQSSFSTTYETSLSESFDMLTGDDLVVAIGWRTDGGTYSSISSITFDGVAPDASYVRGWPDRVEADIYVWKDLASTSGDIDATFSTGSAWGYTAFSLNNLASATAYDNDEWYDNTGSSINRTYDGVAGGYLISMMTDEDYLGTTVDIVGSGDLTDIINPLTVPSNSNPFSGRFTLGASITATGTNNISNFFDYTRGAAGQTVVLEGIPEPATFALFGFGALAMTAVRRRK